MQENYKLTLTDINSKDTPLTYTFCSNWPADVILKFLINCLIKGFKK